MHGILKVIFHILLQDVVMVTISLKDFFNKKTYTYLLFTFIMQKNEL